MTTASNKSMHFPVSLGRASMTTITHMTILLGLLCFSCYSQNGTAAPNKKYVNQQNSKSVNRIAYGIVFEYKYDSFIPDKSWRHIFVLQLPARAFQEEQNYLAGLHVAEDLGEPPPRILCRRNAFHASYNVSGYVPMNFCHHFEEHVQFLIHLARQGYRNLNTQIDNINALLPHEINEHSAGELPTQHLTTFDFKQAQVEFQARSLRTAKFIERIGHNHTMFIDFYANITLHTLQFLTTLIDLTNSYTLYMRAVEVLIKGSLPTFLFPPTVIQDMLAMTIPAAKAIHGPHTEIIHQKLNYYYKDEASFQVRRYASNLYVIMDIPISTSGHRFQVYGVNSYPIPLHQETYPHTTQAHGLPDYVAISISGGRYLPISNAAWPTFNTPSLVTPYRDFTTITPLGCLMSLFFENKTSIKSQCSFTISLQTLHPFVRNLYDNTFLLINITSYTLQCGTQLEYGSCTFCTLQIPAKCSLYTRNHIIPQTATSNDTHTPRIKPQYIVNLAVLLSVFQPSHLTNISGDTSFSSQPNITIPPYAFYTQDSLKNSLTVTTNVNIDLGKASEAAKTQQKIPYNIGPSDPLKNLGSIDSFFTTNPGMLLQAVTVLTLLLFFNGLYLNYQVRQIQLQLASLHSNAVV